MWASSQGRVDAVQALLEAGSDVNKVDSDGLNALMWAAGSEASQDDTHRKGLLEKATKGHVKVVTLLLRYGAEYDRQDKDGITAIMFASYHGHVHAVKALLNAGTNADIINKAGKTAMQLARASGHQNVIDAIQTGPTHLVSLPSTLVACLCGPA
jgi:ankyrin repeat protein